MNILHLEDSDNDAALISEAVCSEIAGCLLTRVETRKTFLEAMDRDDWDIILADHSLPSFDGISAMKLAVEKLPDVPFIFVTGSLGEELAVATLKSGATDYILKYRLDRLPQAILRARRECESAAAKKRVEQKLEASLREKELLLQEVHHRVNNNLQIICSLLDMHSDAVNDPILAFAFRESQQRVQSMAMIHAMLYASSSLKDIDFAEYTGMLAAEVSSAYGVDPDRIQVVLDLEPTRLEIGCAIPCGLILNELLSNAFKYAFPNGRRGEVRISLQQEESSICLTVEDTGVGLPDGHGTSARKSLGLHIVSILTRQLGGSMETTSNGGAHFVLRFTA
jgi:two-component sensor histidine kinase